MASDSDASTTHDDNLRRPMGPLPKMPRIFPVIPLKLTRNPNYGRPKPGVSATGQATSNKTITLTPATSEASDTSQPHPDDENLPTSPISKASPSPPSSKGDPAGDPITSPKRESDGASEVDTPVKTETDPHVNSNSPDPWSGVDSNHHERSEHTNRIQKDLNKTTTLPEPAATPPKAVAPSWHTKAVEPDSKTSSSPPSAVNGSPKAITPPKATKKAKKNLKSPTNLSTSSSSPHEAVTMPPSATTPDATRNIATRPEAVKMPGGVVTPNPVTTPGAAPLNMGSLVFGDFQDSPVITPTLLDTYSEPGQQGDLTSPENTGSEPGIEFPYPVVVPGYDQSHQIHIHDQQPLHRYYTHGLEPAAALPTLFEAQILADHIRSFWGSKECAEYVVDIRIIHSHNSATFEAQLPVHGLLIARSTTMTRLVAIQQASQDINKDGLKTLKIHLRDDFLTSDAMSSALAFLYGFDLPPLENIGTMSQAVAYQAAGYYLQIHQVIVHGMACVRSLLSWENVGELIRFTILSEYPDFPEQDPSSQDSSPEEHGKLAYLGRAKLMMMEPLMEFLVSQVTQDFIFQQAAPQLAGSPRLPLVVESRPSIFDPRLARLQFGDAPPEGPESLDISLKLSSVLITLPLFFINTIFQNDFVGSLLGWVRVADIMREVVNERERRRLNIIGGARVVNSPTRRQLGELQQAERLEPTPHSPSGFVLVKA